MRKKIIVCELGGGMEDSLDLLREEFDLLIISQKDLLLKNSDCQLFIDCDNYSSILNYLEKYIKIEEISGVICLGFERGVPLAAKIAENYGLPGINSNQSEILTDKLLMNKFFVESKIPCAKTISISGISDLALCAEKIGYPCVLKPRDSAGARGVIKVEKKEDLKEAYNLSSKISKNLIIQEFLTGSEHSIEGIVYRKKFYITGFSDRVFRYSEYKPYFVEEGDILFSKLSDRAIKEYSDMLQIAVDNLDLNYCVLKADLITTRDGPKIIELAGRLGSPNFWKLNNLAYGTNSVRAALSVALRRKPLAKDITMVSKKAVSFKCKFFKEGFFQGVEGLKEAEKVKGFYHFGWWKGKPPKINEYIGNFRNLSDMVLYVVSTGETSDEAEQNSIESLSKIKVLVK